MTPHPFFIVTFGAGYMKCWVHFSGVMVVPNDVQGDINVMTSAPFPAPFFVIARCHGDVSSEGHPMTPYTDRKRVEKYPIQKRSGAGMPERRVLKWELQVFCKKS